MVFINEYHRTKETPFSKQKLSENPELPSGFEPEHPCIQGRDVIKPRRKHSCFPNVYETPPPITSILPFSLQVNINNNRNNVKSAEIEVVPRVVVIIIEGALLLCRLAGCCSRERVNKGYELCRWYWLVGLEYREHCNANEESNPLPHRYWIQ